MATALIIGLRGRPVPGAKLIELNASPEGTTPMARPQSHDPNRTADAVDAGVCQRHAVDQRLGRRLDGEQRARIAHFVDLAVGGCAGDAERRRVGFGQFGEVAGDLAAFIGGKAPVQTLEKGLDR